MSGADDEPFVSWNLAELTAVDVRRYLTRRTTILVPLGSTEQHGSHLPLCTDTITATAIVQRVSAELEVLHTPTVWTGYSPQHLFEPGGGRGTVTLRSSTYQALLLDVGRSLVHHGFDRLVFVNGHGGNKLVIDPVLRKLRHDTGAQITFVHAILEGGVDVGILEGVLENAPERLPGGHGSELETSQDLAWDARLVRMERAAPWTAGWPAHLPPEFARGDGRPGIAFEGRAHFSSPLDYGEFGEIGAPGDATTATAEKGEEAFRRLAGHVARGVAALERMPVDVHTRAFDDHAL